MGEFIPVDPKGKTDRQLLIATLKATEQVHGCLESHIESTRQHREKVGHQLGELGGRISVVEGTVSTLGKMFGARQLDDGDDPPPKPRVGMSWKEHGKIALTIIGSISGVVIVIRVLAPGLAAFFTEVWHAIMTVQL